MIKGVICASIASLAVAFSASAEEGGWSGVGPYGNYRSVTRDLLSLYCTGNDYEYEPVIYLPESADGNPEFLHCFQKDIVRLHQRSACDTLGLAVRRNRQLLANGVKLSEHEDVQSRFDSYYMAYTQHCAKPTVDLGFWRRYG